MASLSRIGSFMNVSEVYLEQALEELEILRKENQELKTVCSIYKEVIKDIKEELEKYEKRTV